MDSGVLLEEFEEVLVGVDWRNGLVFGFVAGY